MVSRATPIPLRLLRGNPHKKPVPKEPHFSIVAKVPGPPPFLEDYAIEEWHRTAGELHGLGLLTVVDEAALAGYCAAYGRWRTAEEALRRMADKDALFRGLVIKSKHGFAIENPLVYTSRRAMQEMLRFASEFGFTPAVRARVAAGIAAAAEPKSKFGDLLA
jgi:P27 family predicted phage terminase small subunit